MKRKLFACFLALTMLTVLTACGGKAANSSASASADTSEAMVPDYTENDSYASYTGSDSGSGGFDETESLPTDAAEQKIIYTGDLNLETTDFDAATRSLSALAEELGGYVENSSIGSSSRGYRWADYTIRIPSGQFQRFFEQVGELAHETWRSTNQAQPHCQRVDPFLVQPHQLAKSGLVAAPCGLYPPLLLFVHRGAS